MNSGFSSWFLPKSGKILSPSEPQFPHVPSLLVVQLEAGPGSHIASVDAKSHGVRARGARAHLAQLRQSSDSASPAPGICAHWLQAAD